MIKPGGKSMDSDNNNNPGCFPFSDGFLPIFMFFFHLNDPGQGQLNNLDDSTELEGDDENEHN